MGCYRCGSPEGNEGQVCSKCQRELTDRRSARIVAPPPEEFPSRNNIRWIAPGIAVLILSLTLSFFIYRSSSNSKPTAGEVEATVRQFLLTRNECSGGNATIEGFRITSIGDFVEGFGGHPVYASYLIHCQKPGVSSTYDGTKYKDAAAAFIRKNALGNYEAFVPELFSSFEKEMQAEFNKAFTH